MNNTIYKDLVRLLNINVKKENGFIDFRLKSKVQFSKS